MRRLMEWFHRFSILKKLIVVFLVVFILLGVSSTYITQRKVYDVLVERTAEGNLDKLETSGLRVVDMVRRGADVLIGLRINKNLQSALGKTDLSPNDLIDNMYLINDVMLEYSFQLMNIECKTALVSNYGSVYATWEMIDLDSLDVLVEKYDEFESSGLYGTPLYRRMEKDLPLSSNDEERYHLTFMLPVMNAKNTERLGMLVLAVPQSYVQKYINFDDLELHSTFLVDEEGNVISGEEPDRIGMPASELLGRNLPENGKGYFYAGRRDEYFVSYCKIENLNWYVVDVMENKSLRQQANQAAMNAAAAIPVSIVFAMVFLYFLARSITRPLKKLSERMVEQDYMVLVKGNREYGKNEIRMLEGSFRIMMEKLDELMEENLRKEREKRETEVKALQSQIRPHFLFNTLNTIKCAILNENKDKAADMIYSLIMLLHLTVVRGDELVSLKMELEGTGYYLDLVKLRHGLQIRVEYGIEPGLEEFKLPKLLLQPLVENSVLHGFLGKKDGWVLRIRAGVSGGFLFIRVEDNGVGLAEKKEDRPVNKLGFSGIGVDNVEKRMKLYWGEESCLRLYRSEDGWTVCEMKLCSWTGSLEQKREGSNDEDSCAGG